MEKTIKYLENGEYHYATVRSVGDLAQLKTNSKETLVEAINELWNGGGNADPSKAPKPEGYDQLVQDVADAVKNQQEISQQWIEWQNEEAQLTEERKQAYLQAMKEMQEAIDKAKADAAALDDKTAKLDEQITKTFSDLDTNIQNMHEQLQKEADRMNKDLQDTKGSLSTLRTDLQNTQMDNGKIHDDLTNINGKFEHKVWQTDLDPLKEQIDRAETSVQQTKDELLGKASRQDLDTVSNTVSKLDTQLKETSKGVEISVKKDELGGEIAEALTNKTNILLGTRRFTTNNWQQREHVEICSDPWKGFLVAKQNSPIEGIQQAYEAKAGTTYTFSLFAKMDTLDDSSKPQIILAKNNLDTSLDTKIDVWRKEIDDITSDFKRYDLTFTPSEDCTIYPHVISNSNNPIFVCGYQLEIGKISTPWEPNQEDVGDYVEKSEAQFNVYNDKIQALTEKQRQQGDTQEKLRTEVTQTAEGTRQVSENLKKTNDDITKLRGEFEVKADHMKSEYETYTNKAVGQISDSTLNLIRNSSFQNKDSDFDQWQNISAKANVRSDENGLRWVELTQSGLTTNNPEGITSNYFNIKQGKVTVAVDIKSGDKASLDNDSVLSLELYNDVKKRVDFYDVSLSQLGLSKELLGDHKVHRGLYRLGIDRNDAKYMTVKAKLVKNGDLYFTNFSARLSSIDDGAYEPNPDDLNQQILKQNTKIEQNAKEVAIKANSVDVTRDIKSAVENNNGGGVNLLKGTKDFRPDSIWFPLGAWVRTNDTYNDLTIFKGKSTEDWNGLTQYYSVKAGETYTFSLNARYESGSGSSALYIMLHEDPENGHKAAKVSPWSRDITLNENWQRYSITFTVNSDGYIKPRIERGSHNKNVLEICGLKLERGTVATPWTPASEDTSTEIKSAKDAAIQVASDQINLHVNEISTQFDDKLNRRINEQKTASEKFTSDGIEQVVTKVTNVKNDVDRLGDNLRNTGSRNLLHNTSDQWRTLTNNNDWLQQTTASSCWTSTSDYHGGNKFTYAAKITNNSHQQAELEIWLCDQNKNFINGQAFHAPIPKGANAYDVNVTFPITTGTWYIRSWIIFTGGHAPKGDIVQVKDERLVEGVAPGSWSPNPEDINQQITNTNKKIDTQTLDSANIDNMRTQGHYFVRNLSGNPIGGWVYVDVTGNNNDRVRQDVYADQNNQHKYRSWNGSRWSDWEQGAYLSDVKTEVTASVKNLGDRVTTEVNSVTSKINNVDGKVNNLKIGGRNLLKGTRDFNSKYWYQSGDHTALADNPTDPSTKELHSWLDWHSYKNNQTIQLDPSKNYMISADIAIYGGDGNGLYVTPYGTVDGQASNLVGTDVNLAGFPRQVKGEGFRRIYLPVTAHGRTLKDFRIEGHGNWNAGSGSVFISKIALYEGNTPMAWSDSSDDFVEAIKEVNTKWDVANGQIQGKVTATDVNNILNGKGYATQSWAQTMFQMKSDSITLQAVRDNITNGIQNQVNSINNRVTNAQIGERNLAVGTNRGKAGWWVDPGNGTASTDIALLNGVKGLHINNTKKSTSWWVVCYPFDMGKLKPNTYYTISFDIQTSENTNGGAIIDLARGNSSGSPFIEGRGGNITTRGGEITHITRTLKTGASIENNGQALYINSIAFGSSNVVNIANLMIVEGTQSSVWKPAPEDQGSGQNLLRGTADFSWPTGIGMNNSFEFNYERFDDSTIAMHLWNIKSNGTGIYTKWGGAFPDGQIQVGEQYTFSFDVKGSGKFLTVKNESEPGKGMLTLDGVNVPSEWARVSVAGTIQALDKAFIIYFAQGANVWIKNVKIERGAIATPWTPHPFDDKDKGVNLLKSTAYWNPADWNHISNNVWYDDGWVDSSGHKAYGHHTARQGLGQTVYVTQGVYTWSAKIYLHGLDSNDFVYPYMGDGQYNGTAQVQDIRKPMLGVNDQNRWIDYSTTFYVKNAGNLCVRPELNRDHGNIHVGSQKLEHGMVATPWSPSPLDDKNATITLDSADINSMKTQGHYFVRNLANSPIAGWVYVDVTGNNNNRLKQEVYQDNGYEHRSRRWTGRGWTEWTTDVNNKNVVSQINITPDQIKIASNKIVIDGNTDIHGDLRTDRVRLVGKNGAIDMTGDTGIKLTNNDGSSMLLGRGNIDLMYKNDFRMNIDSSLMTIMQRNQFTGQNKPMAILNIGASWNHSYEKIRGADIRYNPGNVNDVNLHGADYLALSYNKPNLIPGEANIKPQLVMAYQDLKFDENHYLWRKGVNVADDLTIQEYQRINVGYRDKEDQSGKWTNDPLMIHRMQWGASSQADRYQPTVRLGYSKDSMGSAGVTFLWNQVKPFGNRDISDLGEIWFNGQRFVFGWASHERMFNNQNQPAFMRLDDKGGIMSGIAFTPGSTWDLGSGAWNITASVMNHGG